MLPYFLLLFITAFVPLIYYQTGRVALLYDCSEAIKRRNKMTINLFFIGLFILLSLRDITVGKDLRTYEIIFENCCITPFEYLSNMEWERGYTFYNKLISLISEKYRFFLIVTAFISLAPIYKLYLKEKKFGFLLIVLFINMPCFLMLFSGLRQAIAISIGIFAYSAVENKKYIKGLLWILLAMSFHSSAFILFLLYPALILKVKTKHLLYIVPMLFVVYAFRTPIFMFIINYLPNKYIEFYGETQQTGAFGMMILFLMFSIFSFVVLDELIMEERDYFMRNILMITTIIQLFVPIHGLIQRASYYFLVFAPISIVSIVGAPKKSMKSVSNAAVVVMSIFFAVYFFYTAYFSTDNLLDVFPYKFFWSR